jgi:23S rRNA pseudouridine955/2504/2580 synthase
MSEEKSQSKIQFITIEDREGQRIDNFLIGYFHYKAPKSLIYRLIRKGVIRVNKKRIQPTYKLNFGDIVKIPSISIDENEQKPIINAENLAFLESRILFEDQYFLVLNKPQGLAVHGGSGISSGLIERLRIIRPNEKRLELVHRLDKATSGCIIIAKKHQILTYFHELLTTKKNIKKTYHALVKGKYDKRKNKIDLPLLKYKRPSGEHAVCVDEKGKASITTVNVIKHYQNKNKLLESTLVQARPLTGRTHQLRVHLKAMNSPIIGDEKYGDYKINQEFINHGYKRLFLHAYELKFTHPITGQAMTITAPYDEAFIACTEDLSKEALSVK